MNGKRILNACAIIGAALLMTLSPSTAWAAPQSQDSSLEFGPCPASAPPSLLLTIDCGYLHVHQTPGDPDSDMIHMAVAVIHSQSPSPEPDPLLHIAGGPGGANIAYMNSWFKHPILKTRDIIVVDIRGAGYSQPSLDCPEFYIIPERALDGNEGLRSCRRRLIEQGIDLTQYNSSTIAADIEMLRQALNVEQWNIYGISYGTRIAGQMMQAYPDSIRSVILDGTFPTTSRAYDDGPIRVENAYRGVIEQCQQDRRCNRSYPDLEEHFTVLLDWEGPNTVTVSVPVSATATVNGSFRTFAPYELTTQQILLLVYDQLYNSAMQPLVPLILERTYRRDERFLQVLYYRYWDNLINEPFSEGVYYSVMCHEEEPFSGELRAPDYEGFADFILSDLESACANWRAGEAPASFTDPIESDIPTLLIVGALDPITPPFYSEAAAETLSNHHLYTFPGLGHGVMQERCPTTIAADFLAHPNTEPDGSCISQMKPTFVYRIIHQRKMWIITGNLYTRRLSFIIPLIGFGLFFLGMVTVWPRIWQNRFMRDDEPPRNSTIEYNRMMGWLAWHNLVLVLILPIIIFIILSGSRSGVLMFGLPLWAAPLMLMLLICKIGAGWAIVKSGAILGVYVRDDLRRLYVVLTLIFVLFAIWTAFALF